MAKKYGDNPVKYCNQIYNFLYNFNLLPDKTILLTGDVDKSIKRAEQRDAQKYTEEERSILVTCSNLYMYFAHLFEDRFVIVNRDNDDSSVINDINDVVKLELKRKGR